MKATRTFVLGAAVLGISLVAPRPSTAGVYHTNFNTKCSECHTMHYSQQHKYADNTAAGPPEQAAFSTGPHEALLRAEPNDLCLSCHENQTFAPDVLHANTNGGVRQAGALNDGSDPDYPETSGHTLGSTATPRGFVAGKYGPTASYSYDPAVGLECVHCHTPHGSGRGGNDISTATSTAGVSDNPYRNLLSMRGVVVSFEKKATGTPTVSLGADTVIRKWYGDGVSTLAERYDHSNVDFLEPVADNSGMAAFCKGCHAQFHGNSTTENTAEMWDTADAAWLRHPAAEGNISANTFKTKVNRVKVMSPTGDWGPTDGSAWTAPSDLTPTCITCHKGHGNKNPFGLVYMGNGSTAGGITEEGDADGTQPAVDGGGARKLCKQCHGMGGAA